MKRVMVTGGTGFVGSNLTRRLLRERHEVHLLVRRGHDPWRIEAVRADVQLHEVQFDDLQGLTKTVETIAPDWVFHLAAYGAYSWQTDAQRIYATNLLGVVNLLDACLGVGFEVFVNTGSSSEYGLKDHPPAEDEIPEPNSCYSVAKTAATLHCGHTARSRGANIRTLRLYSVYGAFEEPARLLPTLIVNGLRGVIPPLVNPTIARDFVYVDDVCQAYLLAAETPVAEPGAVFNVGTGVQTTIEEAVSVASELLGVSAEPKWASMPDRRWDTKNWVADRSKIRSELGWEPRYGFRVGFREMVEWLRTEPGALAFYESRLSL